MAGATMAEARSNPDSILHEATPSERGGRPADALVPGCRGELAGEQVAEVGGWLGQEAAPGTGQVQVFPPGGADAPVAGFQDARAGDGGGDRRMGGGNGLGTFVGQVMQHGPMAPRSTMRCLPRPGSLSRARNSPAWTGPPCGLSPPASASISITVDLPEPFSPASTVTPRRQFQPFAQQLFDRRDRRGPARGIDRAARVMADQPHAGQYG
jgi:hypothetical protein